MLSIIYLSIFFSYSLSANDEIGILHQRLFNEYMGNVSGGDASSLLNSQLSDGNWTDINYDDHSNTNWIPIKHLERLKSMSQAYNNTANTSMYLNQELLEGIEKGLIYWKNRDCYSSNWWFNDIGQQRQLGVIAVLMKGLINETAMLAACSFLVEPPQTHDGTNLVWISTGLIQHGIARDSLELLNRAVENIRSTIYIKDAEGVQREYSYLFHGMQLYNGGYGSWLIGDVTLWLYNLRGLSIGFNEYDIKAVSRFLLEGDQWLVRHNQYDFSSTGRNITRKNGIFSSHLKNYNKRMAELDPGMVQQYQAFTDHINKNKNNNSLTGNKIFWRADHIVNRTPESYFSVKMCSKRTIGTEFMNGENKLGFWLPFGATCIMKNATEYYNIFPLWDWTKIPGITCPEVTPPFTGQLQTQNTAFVGGVSNGKFGMACMDFDKEKTSARKSWFMYENEIIALGAGISSTHDSKINTTLNQCFKVGSVLVNGEYAATEPNQIFQNTKWLHHGNVGYIFPEETATFVSNNRVSGNWNAINGTESSSTVSGDIVKLWITHGSKPVDAHYAYIINTSILPHEMEGYLSNLPFEIISNTKQIQAVTMTEHHVTAVTFFSKGILRIHEGLEISVQAPCALLIDERTNPVKITVSDPTQTLSSIEVGLNYGADGFETLVIDLPNNDNRGRSVTRQAKTTRINQLDGVIILNKPLLPLTLNEEFQLESVVNLSSGEENQVTWSSNDADAVRVDQEGNVFARNYGSAIVKASAGQGTESDEVMIHVQKKVIDADFNSCENMIFAPGGNWECVSGILELTEPVGSLTPSPTANHALYDLPVKNNFVMNTRVKVKGSVSPFNDFCILWDHRKVEDTYKYIHLSERNDFSGSGMFSIKNGLKSVELEDVAFPVQTDVWMDVTLIREDSLLTLFVNEKLFLQAIDEKSTGGYIGLGSYNDPCSFSHLTVWVPYEPIEITGREIVPERSPNIHVYPNPSKGEIYISLTEEMTGADLHIYSDNGKLIFEQPDCQKNSRIRLPEEFEGLTILKFLKEKKIATVKIIIQK